MGRYEIDFLPEYTDEALLGELRRIAACLPPGEPLTKTAYKRYCAKVAANTVSRRFGGWNQALQKAGLGHLYVGQPVSEKMKQQPARGKSNEDLIAELKRVHALARKPYLTTEDFKRHSIVGVDVVRHRFGGFRKALAVAGISRSPKAYDRFTDAQCFENLATVWTHFGRAPQYREMFEQPSTIMGKTYVNRWGTWRKAIIAFAGWADSEGGTGETLPARDQPSPQPAPLIRKPRTQADRREIPPGLQFKVFKRDRFRCVACGRSPATHLNTVLHADHILAVANGGKTVLENLQTLCRDCNLGKGRTLVP